MLPLFLLFTVGPVVELYLLIELGRATSAGTVVAVVLCTGFAGAALAKRQGLGLLRRMNEDLAAGRLPTEGLLDGLMILFGGALLITPGLVTDALGLALLFPPTRRVFKAGVKRWIQRQIELGRAEVRFHASSLYDPHADMDYDIDMEEDE